MTQTAYQYLACIALTLWIAVKFKNYVRSVILALKLPGPKTVPIFGNVLLIKDTPALLSICDNITKRQKPCIRAWMFVLPIFIIYEPEHLKIVMSNSRISEKNFFYRVMHNFIGDGLITSTGSKWKVHRKLIQPFFHTSILETHFQSFHEAALSLLEKMSGKREVQISRFVNSCVLRALHKIVLGVELDDDTQSPFRSGEFVLLKKFTKPWLFINDIFQQNEMHKEESKKSHDMKSFVKSILDEKLAHKKKGHPCLLDRLIDLMDNDELTEDDVVGETITFMLAGQDSVAAALAFCLYHMAKYPEVQEKARAEIDKATKTGPLKLDHVNQMHYLEQCIKETLRLLPSVPLVARVLNCDVTLGQHTFPKGSNLLISPFCTHRLPHVFPEPLKYDPDRFSEDNIKKIHPFGFIPFSIGPRNCLGYKFAYLELKTIMASVLRNYELDVVPGKEELTLSFRITLRASGGVWLRLTPRS